MKHVRGPPEPEDSWTRRDYVIAAVSIAAILLAIVVCRVMK